MTERFIGTAYHVGKNSIALTIPQDVVKKMKIKAGARIEAVLGLM